MTIPFLTGQYDHSLVVLSYAIACFAAYSAIDLAHRIFENPARQWLWLALGAFAMGTGIWSMHFIGMQAFSLPIALGYDLVKTLISLVAAIAVAALALYITSRTRMGWSAVTIGAVVMGAGICIMHYTGMAALEIQPGIQYDPLLLAASALIAVSASGAALFIVFNLRRITGRMAQLGARFGAAAIMGVAVVGMHYTGMAAANFPVGSICRGASSLTGAWTAGPVAIFAVVLTGLIMILAAIDAAAQAYAAAERKRREEEEHSRFLAFNDAITGLPNRIRFHQAAPEFINDARRHSSIFDLYYCVFQLPGQQNVQVVDQAARVLADRLRSISRSSDLLVRHDRSGFVLLRHRSGEDDLPPHVRARLLDACRMSVTLDSGEFSPQAHVGTAEYPKDGVNTRSLLQAASRTPGTTQRPASPAMGAQHQVTPGYA